jgi:hypothetical protein
MKMTARVRVQAMGSRARMGCAVLAAMIACGAAGSALAQGAASQPVIVVSPSSTDFGNVQIGTTSNPIFVNVTNQGAVAGTLSAFTESDPADFKFTTTCVATLPAYSSCGIEVYFTPQSEGYLSGKLTFSELKTGAALQVLQSGTGQVPQNDIIISPTVVNFGNQGQGTTGNPTILNVSNEGSSTITFSSLTVTDAANYVVSNGCGTALAAYSSCQISIAFSPQGTGNYNDTLTLDENGTPSALKVSLSGVGVAPQASQVVIAPTNIDFGNQVVGTSSNPWTVNISNEGATAVSLTSFELTDANDFAIGGNCGPTLAAYSSCQLTVQFTPLAAQNYMATLTVRDSGTPSALTVTLNGTGTTAPNTVQIAPTAVNFTNTPVGTTSNPWTLNFSNEAGTAVTITSLALSDSKDFSFTSSCGTVVAAYSSCNILVYFTPQSVATDSGTLTITTTGTPKTLTVTLNGTGTSSTPVVQIAPTAVTFASTPVGTTSNPWTLNFSNEGNTAVTISSLVLSDTKDFSFSSACGTVVAAYSSCNILVYFTPQSTGGLSGTLTLKSNGNPGTLVVTLNGNGAAKSSTVQLAPSGLTFADTAVGSTNGPQTLVFSNTGSTAVTISSIVLSDTKDYSVTTGCGGTLAANSSCNLYVTFAPQSSGALPASITVNSSGSPTAVSSTLNGTGTTTGGATLQVTPTSGHFGNVVVGTTSSITFTVTNLSAQVITLYGDTYTGYPVFSLTGTCSGTLAAYSSCTLTMYFTPQQTGLQGTTLTVNSSATDPAVQVPIDGTGVAASSGVQLAPASLAFPGQASGTTSAPMTATFNNNGSTAVTISNVVLTDIPYFSLTNNCPTVVAAHTSCQILVYFSPVKTGDYFGTLFVYSNGTPSPVSTTLTGTGKAKGFMMAVTPAALTLKAGQAGSALFTLTPTGGYAGSVTLGCAGLPSSASCAFAPATLVADGSNTVLTSKLTVSTTGINGGLASNEGAGGGLRLFGGVSAMMLGLVLVGRRKSKGLMMLVAVLGLAGLASLAGCGSGIGGGSTPVGVSQVTVTATGVGTGTAGVATETQTATFTLNITE